MRLAIIGAGPVGGSLAACLADAGHELAIVDPYQAHIGAIENNGLILEGCLQKTARPAACFLEISDLQGWEPDYLCIATKTSLFHKILAPIHAVVSERSMIVSVQNGLDTEDRLAVEFGSGRVCRMVVNWAGTLLEPGRIRMIFFHPPNYVGAIDQAAVQHAGIFTDAVSASGLETELTPDIKKYEWEKTILNAAMSPTSALYAMTMKEVMEDKKARALVERLLRESISIAEKSGISFSKDIFEKSIRYLSNAGPHKPSLAVDYEQGRETEIEFLNGRIVENARKLGIEAPVHESITLQIKAAYKRSSC